MNLKDHTARGVPPLAPASVIDWGRGPEAGAAWVPAPTIPARFLHPGLSLAQAGWIIRAYRRVSAAIAAALIAAVAAALVVWPRSYTATATLMVHYEVSDPLNGKELPVGQIGSYIATQAELLQTPAVLLAVVDRLKLADNPDYARGFRRGDGTIGEWIAGKVKKKLDIAPSPLGSQLIHVSYTATSAAEAALVANAVAEAYQEQDRDRAAGPSTDRNRRYAKQLEDLKRNVEAAQAKLAEFRGKNGVLDDGGRNNDDAALLTALESRLLDAQNARRIAETRAAQDASVSDEVMASNQVQTLRAQVAAQELRLAQLGKVYGPQHPDLLLAQAQVDDSRRSLAAALQTYAAHAASAVTMAHRLETKQEQAVAEQRAKVAAQSRLRDEAAKHLLELASAQEAYKRALDGRDQVAFAIGTNPSSNVELISPATPPMVASKPNVPTTMALGTIASLLLALAAPLGYELLNRRVRCRDDLERHHGLPVLAELGRLSRSGT